MWEKRIIGSMVGGLFYLRKTWQEKWGMGD